MADATHTGDHHADGHDHPAFPTTPPDLGGIRKLCLGAAVLGFAVFGGLGVINLSASSDPDHHGLRTLFTAYLCGFVFWCSLPFGALLLSMIGFQMQASWGVVFRRIFQASLRTLPLLFVLGLPVIASLFLNHGHDAPYWWADHGWEGEDVSAVAAQMFDLKASEVNIAHREAVIENQHKIHDYLNPKFFTAQYVAVFVILGLLAYRVHSHARRGEDNDDPKATADARGFSGLGIILTVLCLTFFATQWVMSVEPTWASSMFPVVFGMNMFLTTFAFCTLIFYTLAQKGDTLAIVKEKFRIDIGTLTLGFCMVWAYASFCQYMLVWSGNLPEELTYYRKRGGGEENVSAWLYMSYFLMAFHWLIPFITLLMREVKTSPTGMRIMAVLFLTVCACDVCWWILPNVPYKTIYHLPMAFGAILGVGGVWGMYFCGQLAKRPLLPSNHEARFIQTWGHGH